MTGASASLVKMTLDIWNGEVAAINALLCDIRDDQLLRQVAPGRNTGRYLLGHLTARHDSLFTVLGICHAIFPEYETLFISNPEGAVPDYPPIAEIRQAWNNVNIQLAKSFREIPEGEWFRRGAIGFAGGDCGSRKHSTRLFIVLSAAVHMGCHRGQLSLLRGAPGF